ncbi:hypothetical protein [Trujillonella endophytica]|uniref:hypothetical protein n=1 Tax=Trujillonella endophytica TaxID=673521 RepID=UPI001114034C|nr:hypothetical protein [Trujillella endophytica]
MILAAGLLVLAGLGLFVGGLATGTTGYYWSCVACCAAAAVLLIAVRLRPGSRAVADGGTATRGAGSIGADRAPTRSSDRSPARSTDRAADGPLAVTAERAGRHSGPADVSDADATARPAGEAVTPPAEPAATAATDAEPAGAVTPPATTGPDDGDDPPEEDVEVTDLLLVVDLRDQVLVVDEHPRYHLADCSWLRGRATIPLPVAEARGDGFSPCAVCSPDRHLADLARARKAARR